MAGYSAAGQALGFGGDTTLADQMKGEEEEAKRKRLAALQASRVGAGYGSALSPAGQALGLNG